jgi:hypothetical protein
MKNNILNETFQKHLKLLQEKLNITNPTKKEPFLNESDEDVTRLSTSDMKTISITLKSLYDSDLPEFVSGLKSIISDPKVQQFLKSAKHDGNLNDDNISIDETPHLVKVNTLQPSQDEVFLGNSIEWPMEKNPSQIRNFILYGKQEGFGPIVTSGEYVIDGHHRWSQVFCWNKDAEIPTYNIKFNGNEKIPTDIIKKTFLGIASIYGKVDLSDKGGDLNLFVITKDQLEQWLTNKFTLYPDAWKIFCENDVMAKIKPKEAQQIQFSNISTFGEGDSSSYLNKVVVPYLYSNISALVGRGEGLYSRKIMPQTGDITKFTKDIKAGNINFDINVDEPNDQQSTPPPSQLSFQSEKMVNETFQRHLKLLHKKLNESMSIEDLATVSDEALDNAYHYGRSTPGNTFGWQANLKSAEFAKRVIDAGVTDIEKISDAIHSGWNETAKKFVANPDQFSDTQKLRDNGKFDAKIEQRRKLSNVNYSSLPEEEKEKDRVVARALLNAIQTP